MLHIIKRLRRIIDDTDVPHWVLFICWVLIALVITYIRLPHISPSNPLYYRSDESVFRMIGEYWREGLLPYRDLFDHKGPFLYAFYALGTYITPGKLGVFLLLSFFYSISFYYLHRLARLFVNRFEALLIIVAYIGVSIVAFGGCGEHVCLPFIAVPLYYLMHHIHKAGTARNISLIVWFGTGIAFGIILLVKPNISAILCSIVGFILLKLIIEKQPAELFRAIAVLTLGTILSTATVVWYFYSKHTLYDFIFGSYLFNFAFAGKGVLDKDLASWLVIAKYTASLWIVLIFGGILYKRNLLPRMSYFAMSTIAVLSTAGCIPGRGYLQYFMLYSPCVIFALVCVLLCIKNIRGKKITILSSIACLVAYAPMTLHGLIVMRWALYGTFIPEQHRKHSAEWKEYHECLAMRTSIPKRDLNNILAYNCQGNIYLYLQAKPPVKYFMLQDFLLTHVPLIKEDLESSIIKASPKWIITRGNYLTGIDNPILVRYIEEQYEHVHYQPQSSELQLFRKKR